MILFFQEMYSSWVWKLGPLILGNLTSLRLSFIICKMRIIILVTELLWELNVIYVNSSEQYLAYNKHYMYLLLLL